MLKEERTPYSPWNVSVTFDSDRQRDKAGDPETLKQDHIQSPEMTKSLFLKSITEF